jgi:hypothetical protein
MTLFDGSRWDRIRRFGYGWHGERGRWHAGLDVHAWAVPLPRVRVYFEECEVSIGVSIGDALNDPIIGAGAGVELPGWAADLLVLVWPAATRANRRVAAGRLFRATPQPHPGGPMTRRLTLADVAPRLARACPTTTRRRVIIVTTQRTHGPEGRADRRRA